MSIGIIREMTKHIHIEIDHSLVYSLLLEIL